MTNQSRAAVACHIPGFSTRLLPGEVCRFGAAKGKPPGWRLCPVMSLTRRPFYFEEGEG